jgi:hypothetical protein
MDDEYIMIKKEVILAKLKDYLCNVIERPKESWKTRDRIPTKPIEIRTLQAYFRILV